LLFALFVASLTTVGHEIVGRDQDLTCIRSFIDNAGPGPSALVLVGEPGIGKSALWLAGVEHAAAQERLVLASRPAEAERSLAYVGIGDLFERALDDVLPRLSPPRRRALEGALLVEDTAPNAVDSRALGLAVRDGLQMLAERLALVVAIDDLQWFDAASTDALAFALRRLDACRVLFLLARRSAGAAQPSAIEQALAEKSVERLSLGPLSVGALHRLLRDRLHRAFARQTLLRIYERSEGNPFYALELGRALGLEVDLTQPLPVPRTLEGLLRARLVGLPAATREALAFAAALGAPSSSLLERAGVDPHALDAAVVAHVIDREDGTLRFSHPLLSSVLYAELGDERRSIHRRIAEVVDDPLDRARHLGLAAAGADAEVAAVLDEAARIASGRGAAALAAELAEHALRLTPPAAQDERRRRALAAAQLHHAAGEWTRARTLTTDLLAETGIGSVRPEALMLLSELENQDRSIVLLDEALWEARSRPAMQSAILCRLAWARRFKEEGMRHAREAFELADEVGDDVLRAQARAVQAVLVWFAGENDTPEELSARARDFANAVGGEHMVREATQAIVNTLAPASRRDEARALFEREYAAWRERDEPRAARASWGLAWVEFWAGHWELAADHAARAHDISIQYGLEMPQDHLPIAVIAAYRGLFEVAREHSRRALDLAAGRLAVLVPQHRAVLGLVALSNADMPAADDWLDQADRHAASMGWREPSVRWWTGDRVELLLELGRPDDAVRVLDRWEADAVRVEREWVLAHVQRCRGLVAAARGELEAALDFLAQAVVEHEAVGDPFGRGQALLAVGIVRRRMRQKRLAREAIEAALEAFETVGASGWAAKARAELGRIGGRTRAEGLTPAERRVASLVAEGRTNREVAAALFLGERTVASHLNRIYAKVGVRSRTELAVRLRADESA
jgi:DNA-binding CsgD family transcriptional regulator